MSSGRQLSACAMDLVGSEGARSPIETDSGGFCWAPSSSWAYPDPLRAGAAAGGVPWDDERRVLMRRRVSCARRVRPSRPVTRPPSYRVEVSRPARASKTGGPENFSFFYSLRVPNFSQTGLSPGVSLSPGVPVVHWTRSGTRRNQRVRSSRPLASRQLRSSKKGRATTTSPLNDQCLRRPRRPRPFQDFTQPSSRVPSRRTPPDPRVPCGVHTASARHAAREPPSGGFSVEGTRPAKQGFQTPKRTAAYPARAPRVGARRPPNDGADVRQSGVHTRGTSQTFPPRPRLAPARSPPPPRRPKGAHLQKPNGPKTKNEIPK